MHKKILSAVLPAALTPFAVFFIAAAIMAGSDWSRNALLTGLAIALLLSGGLCVLLLLAASRSVSQKIAAELNGIDVSLPDKKNLDPLLAPLGQHLEDHNALLARQMEDQRKEHATQDEMRRDFTANVSHELKTPLTSISGYAELLKSGLAQPEDMQRFAGKIYDESQRLITLVSDIIKLSEYDGKDLPVRMEEIDLLTLCQDVLSHLEIAAKERGITFTLLGEHLKIRGDRQTVEEIVYNLCDNAIKYNNPGGLAKVEVRQCVDGVELTVSDTGIGIPEEDLPHIFERFYRVDKSHSKEVGGTGLGLSIVKHAARFMDASVSAESKLGEGTTIRILF